MIRSILAVLVGASLSLAAFQSHAMWFLAKGDCKPLGRLPTTINQSGKYCLKRNQTVNMPNGTAVSIEADDVLLDLKGYKIENRFSAVNTTAVGIHSGSHASITIKNGTIRGFQFGINMAGPDGSGRGNLIEGVRVFSSNDTGIRLGTFNAIVRDNIVGGVGSLREPEGAVMDACGIRAIFGGDNRIVNNQVFSVRATEQAAGICFEGATGAAENNTTNGIAIGITGIGNGPGISADLTGTFGTVTAVDNRIIGTPDWTPGSTGIDISGTGADSIGICRDNIITHYATGMHNCTDAGGNTIEP